MKTKTSTLRVVFNASVIFSAFRSSRGASRALLFLIKQNRINALVSETILDEALKHADKIPMDRKRLKDEIGRYFPKILPAPKENIVSRYKNLMIDPGDAHLFATAKEVHATHLVSLDKHHVLILSGKIPHLSIIPPAELLKKLKG